MKEIETKIIDFDERRLRASLKRMKAEHLGKIFYRRHIFDMHPNVVAKTYDEFVRVRTDGKKNTITYKYRRGKGLANTDEIEVEVADFDKAAKIISKLWKKGKDRYYQENIVEKWRYGDAEIDLIRWPNVKPYLEIEAPTAKRIRSIIKSLEIGGEELGNTNLVEIFDRSGQHGKDVGDLRFRRRD